MIAWRSALLLMLVLGLAACGGGSSSATPAGPPPTQAFPEAWTQYVKSEAKPIRSLDPDSPDDSDLAFLDTLLAGKRLVTLGESGHGVAEFSQAKIRLIKYLHEHLGYDVIAFESSILSCYRGNERAATLDATTLMQSSVFGVWSTGDVVKLFAYLKATQATPHPLILAGFDIQLTTADERQARPAVFQEVVAKVDPVYAQEVFDLDTAFIQNRASATYLKANLDSLKASYQALTAFLDGHMGALQQAFPDRPLYPLVVRQAAWGMSDYLDELYAGYVSQNLAQGYGVRDAGMAANLQVLLDTLYPGRKVMAWAHNDHLMHDEPGTTLYPIFKNLGNWIANRYGASVYTLGLYMYAGSAAKNDQGIYLIPPAPAGSLENLLHQSGQAVSFLDLSQAGSHPGAAWMFSRMDVRDWGLTTFQMVPHAQFDGILLVDTVHPPAYVPFPAGARMDPDLIRP